MKDLTEGLTAEQRFAVETLDRDLEVAACAGAGKTRVITRRILNLIRRGAAPESIVAITFTRKAAAEMKQRVYADGARCLGTTRGFAGMFIGTIDAFCMKTLQDEVAEFAKFSMLDETQSRIFIERYRKECLLDGSRIDLAENLSNHQDAYGHWVREDRAKKVGIYAELMSRLNSVWYDREKRALWPEDVRAMLGAYRKYLFQNNYFDFSSLLREMIERLDPESDLNGGTVSDFARKLFTRVKYLTVDEYQDVNPAQEYLVGLFKRYGNANLCAVGDADQTIYQFRGSENKSLRRFRETFDPVCVDLDRNFRGTEAVVDIAATVIRGNPHGADWRAMRSGAAAAYEQGDAVYQHCAGFAEECALIPDRIRALHDLGVPYSEMAVLLRRRAVGWAETRVDFPKELAAVLKRAGIPYEVAGVKTLFETKECAAACGIFAYLFNKFCKGKKLPDGSWQYGYYKDRKNFLAMETAAQQALLDRWLALDYPLPEHALRRALFALTKVTPKSKMAGHTLNLQQIYLDFLGRLPILDAEGDPLAEHILYNLGKFSRVIFDFESVSFTMTPLMKLRRFYQYLTDFAPGAYAEGEQDNAYIRSDAVRVMTVHQSKGLEFTAVFLPALRQKICPIEGGRFSRDGEVRSAPDLFPPQVPAEAYGGASGGVLEEERNIFYVALTRAKKFLFLTESDRYGGKYYAPSVLLEEAKRSKYLKPFDPRIRHTADRLPDMRRDPDPITLNFSLLSDYFDCPNRFKLSAFYGFAQPIRPRQGYGKMLHEIMMQIHRLWIDGKRPGPERVRAIAKTALCLPYADDDIRRRALSDATDNALAYVRQNEPEADRIRHAEIDIDLELGEGVSVNGRIDLIRTYEDNGRERLAVVDLKSAGKDAEECLNAEQLKIYALGYRERTGESADSLMIYNLDVPDGSANTEEPVDWALLERTRERILAAARCIRASDLPRTEEACADCRLSGVCRAR